MEKCVLCRTDLIIIQIPQHTYTVGQADHDLHDLVQPGHHRCATDGETDEGGPTPPRTCAEKWELYHTSDRPIRSMCRPHISICQADHDLYDLGS